MLLPAPGRLLSIFIQQLVHCAHCCFKATEVAQAAGPLKKQSPQSALAPRSCCHNPSLGVIKPMTAEQQGRFCVLRAFQQPPLCAGVLAQHMSSSLEPARPLAAKLLRPNLPGAAARPTRPEDPSWILWQTVPGNKQLITKADAVTASWRGKSRSHEVHCLLVRHALPNLNAVILVCAGTLGRSHGTRQIQRFLAWVPSGPATPSLARRTNSSTPCCHSSRVVSGTAETSLSFSWPTSQNVKQRPYTTAAAAAATP